MKRPVEDPHPSCPTVHLMKHMLSSWRGARNSSLQYLPGNHIRQPCEKDSACYEAKAQERLSKAWAAEYNFVGDILIVYAA